MALQGWVRCHRAQQPRTGTPQCSQGPGNGGWSQWAQGGHGASVQISWIILGQTCRPGKPRQIQLADWVSEER